MSVSAESLRCESVPQSQCAIVHDDVDEHTAVRLKVDLGDAP